MNFKNRHGRKSSLFAFCAQALFALCLFSSCGELWLGDKGDIKEEIESAYVTEYKFYYEDPRENPYAKLVTVKHKIDETLSEDEFFPKSLAQGYKASNWVCFDSKTKMDLPLPPNIHTQETPNGVQVTSVLVTQKPLAFYAVSWEPRKDILYTVHHYKQKLGLASYVDTPPFESNYFFVESETKQGEMGALINFLECKKDYPGFEYSMNVLGETNGIITFDGTCQANIYYDRKIINVSVDPNGGAFVADSSTTAKTFSGYYETLLELPKMERQDQHIVGFENDDGEILETLDKFPPQGGTYKTIWEFDKRAAYKVHYMLQKISATASENSAPMTINGKTYYSTYKFAKQVELEDYVGRKTKAQKATAELIPNIANYEWLSTEEKIVEEDGSTVVQVLYNVKPFEITLDANGGTGTAITQTFYTETDCIALTQFAKTGFVQPAPTNHYKFASWNTMPDATGIEHEDSGVLKFADAPSTPITLYAHWVEVEKVNYTVRHLLQKVSATAPIQSVGGRTGTLVSGGKTYHTYYVLGKSETKTDFPADPTQAEFADATLITNLANYIPKGTAGFADTATADIEQALIAQDGSTTIDIYYDVIPFEITLDLNGGADINGNKTITQTFYTETDCITLATPEDAQFSKRKYKFTEWNSELDASGTSYENSKVLAFTEEPATPIILYAQWELVVSSSGFDVTLSAPEDVSIDVDDSVKGEVTITVTLPEGVTAANYAWEIDDVRVAGASSNKLTIRKGECPIGYHLLTCIIKDTNGNIYVANGGFVAKNE